MKIRSTLVAVAGLLLAASNAHADTLKTEADLKPFAERVMASVSSSGIAVAFNVMKPYTTLSDAEFKAALLASETQRDQFGARYGKPVGYEFVSQKRLGESLVRIVYLEKAEKHAYPWLFHFYRTRNGWVLDSFLWNDQASQLFNLPQ